MILTSLFCIDRKGTTVKRGKGGKARIVPVIEEELLRGERSESKGFSAEWIQEFLRPASFKTTMDIYGTLSIH